MSIHRIVTLTRVMLQCNRPLANINRSFTIPQINQFRYIATERQKHSKALKTEKEKLRTFVVQQYLQYVKNYTKVLEKRFPAAMRMYRVFSVGIKDFLSDLKMYIGLRLKVATELGFIKMTRQEIELYHRMPAEMLRIAPVLILSAIPFGNYIIFPLAFLKPRKLLCSHFWSIQQKSEFATLDLKERLWNNRPVFRALQAKVKSIPSGDLKEKWRQVIALMGSGVHPSTSDILNCKELFCGEPYHLSNITYSHAGYLLKMYGLRKGIFRRNKLKHKAFILLEMDKAIIREGGLDEMNVESLRYACYLRGLNASHLSNQDMRIWLQEWLEISQNVDKNSYSLILHCPIFLAYNHPQNWMLIY